MAVANSRELPDDAGRALSPRNLLFAYSLPTHLGA